MSGLPIHRHPLLWAALVVFTLCSTGAGVAGAEQGVGVVDASSITDKVICGYQGWFNCAGDGSPLDLNEPDGGWRHWSTWSQPDPGYQTFELYPAVGEYLWDSLFPTGYSTLGNGEPAELFSSFRDDVIDTHFRWMREYGLDGVALQRFGVELRDPLRPTFYMAENRDAIALRVRAAAEENGRIFYVMYDISGMSEETTDTATVFTEVIKSDWLKWVADPSRLDLLSSPQYAHQDGKPVVGIWGIGFDDRPGSAQQFLALIDWFKRQNCYVIGGVPRKWLKRLFEGTEPGFWYVYTHLDMIMPWTVGEIEDFNDVVNWLFNNLALDLYFCSYFGVDYLPVLYPGFAWSNWNGGDRNAVPRRAGGLLWEMALVTRLTGTTSAYIAMFDEYDEGTAIAKAAEDSSMIPEDQYFLTLSADGTYLSSDYYLRLAGEATKMIKGYSQPQVEIPIAHSLGPVFFRSGMEQNLDAVPNWQDSVDRDGGGKQSVDGYGGRGEPTCRVVSSENADSGRYAIEYAGRDESDSLSFVYFRTFDVNIPVNEDTSLGFSLFPENHLARYVSVDLVMTDGSTLRDSGAVDDAGVSMHPGAGRGIMGRWTRITCPIGKWLNGKVIGRIMIGYDHAAESGDFRGYVDDLIVETATE